MTKELFANDIAKDKTIEELFNFINDFFCDPNEHTSYRIIGLSKDSFICHRTIELYDDEADWGSGYYTEDGYIKIPFDDNSFVYSLPATVKQKEWLEKHHRNADISGVEAWHIIHDFVEETYKQHRWNILESDDTDLYDYGDVPNM